MDELKYMYIAREILVSDGGLKRIDEESVFSSLEEATDFLAYLREEGKYETEPSSSNINFRHEITKYTVNYYDNWKNEITWLYKLNGDLISKLDASVKTPIPFNSVSYQSLFEKGEIIRIKSNYEEKNSHLIEHNYGVVSEKPISKESWKISGKELKDWDGAYIIWLISNETNVLYHEHLNEICLEKFNADIPDELSFLKTLSNYFKNDGNVPDSENIEKVFSENVVVRKINYYFTNKS